jgi:hypothetical protein
MFAPDYAISKKKNRIYTFFRYQNPTSGSAAGAAMAGFFDSGKGIDWI